MVEIRLTRQIQNEREHQRCRTQLKTIMTFRKQHRKYAESEKTTEAERNRCVGGVQADSMWASRIKPGESYRTARSRRQ